MSLTKKDKGEIQSLVKETVGEAARMAAKEAVKALSVSASNLDTEKVEQDDVKSNLDDVKSNLDDVKSNLDDVKSNLEQLDEKWRENGIESESTGLIIAPEDVDIDGETRFTWDEAMCLEAKGKTPKGWRLPTRHEWVLISEEFGMDEATGELSAEKLSKALNLPCDEDDQLSGYFWSSTAYSDSTYAYYLYYNPSLVYPQNYSLKYFGFSVRLVKEVGDD